MLAAKEPSVAGPVPFPPPTTIQPSQPSENTWFSLIMMSLCSHCPFAHRILPTLFWPVQPYPTSHLYRPGVGGWKRFGVTQPVMQDRQGAGSLNPPDHQAPGLTVCQQKWRRWGSHWAACPVLTALRPASPSTSQASGPDYSSFPPARWGWGAGACEVAGRRMGLSTG